MGSVSGSSITRAGIALACALALGCSSGGGEARDPSPGQAGDGAGGQGGAGSTTPIAALIEAGGSCSAGGDCKSGFCFDGVCCHSDCSGLCQSCAIEGSVGTCANVPVGADPHDDCPDEGATSCGRNGACDGTGACAVYAAGTICRAPSCAGSTVSH